MNPLTFLGGVTYSPEPMAGSVRDGRSVLKSGHQGPLVEDVQAMTGGIANGKFSPDTESAVKAFQRRVGLTATGVVDRNTLLALERAGGAQLGARQRPVPAAAPGPILDAYAPAAPVASPGPLLDPYPSAPSAAATAAARVASQASAQAAQASRQAESATNPVDVKAAADMAKAATLQVANAARNAPQEVRQEIAQAAAAVEQARTQDAVQAAAQQLQIVADKVVSALTAPRGADTATATADAYDEFAAFWKKERLGVPTWGWGLGIAGLVTIVWLARRRPAPPPQNDRLARLLEATRA